MFHSLPSTATHAYWLFVEAPGVQFESTGTSGKWVVLRSPADVDQAWSTVARLVRSMELTAAKVSTARAVAQGGYEHHAICVYTQDWQDTREVQRVRRTLRRAGFTENLRYKRDTDTLAGIDHFVYEA